MGDGPLICGLDGERPVLAPHFLRELARDNPLGLPLEARDAEAWWLYVAWPRFKTHSYRQVPRAIRSWWARVTMLELSRAQDAQARADTYALQALQDRLCEPIENHPAGPDPEAIQGALARILR